MAKYLPPGYIDCTLVMSRDTDPDPYSITFGVEIKTPPWTQSDNDDLADAVRDALSTITSNQTTMLRFTSKVGSDGEGPIIESTINQDGTRVGALAVQNTAILVRKITGLGGRYNRGRFYFPDVIESNVLQNGEVEASERATLQPNFNTLLDVCRGVGAGVGLNTSNMVLIHNPRPGEATPTPTPVSSLLVDQFAATQRRRLRR